MLCWYDILCLSTVFQILQFIFYIQSKLHNPVVERKIINNGMHNLDIVKLKFPLTKLYRFEYIYFAQCQQITADVLIGKVFVVLQKLFQQLRFASDVNEYCLLIYINSDMLPQHDSNHRFMQYNNNFDFIFRSELVMLVNCFTILFLE